MAVKPIHSDQPGSDGPNLDVPELAEGDEVSCLGDPARTLKVSRVTATQVVLTYVGPGARIAEKRFHRTGRHAGAPLGGTHWDRLVPLEHPTCRVARARAQVSGMWYELNNIQRNALLYAAPEQLAEVVAECARIVTSAQKALEAEL